MMSFITLFIVYMMTVISEVSFSWKVCLYINQGQFSHELYNITHETLPYYRFVFPSIIIPYMAIPSVALGKHII